MNKAKALLLLTMIFSGALMLLPPKVISQNSNEVSNQVENNVVLPCDAHPDLCNPPVPSTVVDYAPLVFLHSDEKYWPTNPSKYIANSGLSWSHAGKCIDAPVAPLHGIDMSRLGSNSTSPYSHRAILPRSSGGKCVHSNISFMADDHTRPYDKGRTAHNSFLDQNPFYEREGFYLDLNEEKDIRDELRAGTPSTAMDPKVYKGSTVYYEYVPRHFIAYWFFYAYDNYTADGRRSLQAHEGDWEHITIRLNCDNKPEEVAYFRHSSSDTEIKTWGAVRKRGGTHPIVFSAKGSHGSYPDTGPQPLVFPIGLPFILYDYTNDDGRRWSTWTSLEEVKRQPWYGYGGAWGEVGDDHRLFGVGVSGGDYTGPLGPSKYKDPKPAEWSRPMVCN